MFGFSSGQRIKPALGSSKLLPCFCWKPWDFCAATGRTSRTAGPRVALGGGCRCQNAHRRCSVSPSLYCVTRALFLHWVLAHQKTQMSPTAVLHHIPNVQPKARRLLDSFSSSLFLLAQNVLSRCKKQWIRAGFGSQAGCWQSPMVGAGVAS